jgi:hypothetical protein
VEERIYDWIMHSHLSKGTIALASLRPRLFVFVSSRPRKIRVFVFQIHNVMYTRIDIDRIRRLSAGRDTGMERMIVNGDTWQFWLEEIGSYTKVYAL